ncbi:MAG TPA: hypothetical protein VF276_17550 [Chloroflexia bacterium]
MEEILGAVFRIIFRVVAYAVVEIVWELLLQTLFGAIGAGWRRLRGR